jgi:hypothetical protein
LPDGSHGSLQRIKRKDGRTEIHANHPHSEPTVSHWLHFQKDVLVTDDNSIPIIDDDGKPKTRYVAIAYQLEKNIGKNKDQSTWKIVSVNGGGQVSIYFPAEKETSKLHFHLHAPFASTVARDSVRDCSANEQLRDHLADLIVESFTVIREQGLLNMSFLAVLPNPKDLISFYPFYEAIRKKIVNAFKNQSLTPTKSGTHCASTALYRGAKKISDVISDDDLSILTEYEIPRLWAANPPPQRQREDNFLDSLEIDRWDFEQLSTIFKPADKEKIESWLAEKPDDWMMSFYELLGEAKDKHDKNQTHLPSWQKTTWVGLTFPLVRVESTQGIKHVVGNKAYFASEDNNVLPSADIDIVKLAVYSKGKLNDDINEDAKKFLKQINVKPFDTKAVIELRLKHYQSLSKQITDEHYEDIKQFINYWKKNPEQKATFQSVSFLLGTANDKRYWQKATDLCLDNPFSKTGLADLIEIHQKKVLWQRYSEKLTENELKDFVEFAKAIGVMYKLEVIELDENNAIKNPNNPYRGYPIKHTGHAKDYSIPELEQYLTAQKISASRLVWNALVNAPQYPSRASASFKPNQRYQSEQVNSQLIHHLKTHAWIPNKAGEFCTPQAMTREILHPDLPFPLYDSNGLLTAIKFSKEEKDRAEALSRQAQQASWTYQSKVKTAKDNGFDSPEEMDEWTKLAREAKAEGKTPDEFRKQLSSSKKQTEQPNEPVSNPERRSKKVLENSADAPDKQSVQHERAIQVGISEIKAEAKAYLRAKYQNTEHELICQCCHDEMPFKVNNVHYFEAVQCVKKQNKSHFQNYLALCPTCAAMYQYARETDDEKIRTGLIENPAPNDSPAIEIHVTLAGKNYRLRFVGTHWFDLKTIFSSND